MVIDMDKELNEILIKFADSGYDLIADPAVKFLNGGNNREELIEAVRQADIECGNCGCEFDSLYKKVLELL